jgi:hypothetical protein
VWDQKTVLAYLMCAILVVAHAWGRFNTPASNRSSTRQVLYWKSFTGYAACGLLLFFVLAVLLQASEWRKLLLGHSDDSSLPAPLIATLALTTLLPSVPLLQRLDAWALSAFHDWGEIPAEVKRRANYLTPQRFTVTEADVVALRDVYDEDSFGEALPAQLTASRDEGLTRSRLRFTRVVKLYDRIVQLSGEENYGRFFRDSDGEFLALKKRTEEFIRRSGQSLARAARLQEVASVSLYEDLMQERREAFAATCSEVFGDLALFLSHAVLRSEGTEREIVQRLRDIGFDAQPIELPNFPLDDLTLLAVCVLLYLIGLGGFFAHVQPQAARPGWITMACKIGLIRIVTAGMTVWLLQNYAFFRRSPGGRPRYFAYFVCGLVASLVSLLIGMLFHLLDAGLRDAVEAEVPPMIWSGLLCSALAFCCDHWEGDAPASLALRFKEAGGCATVMLIGAAIMYSCDWLPFPVSGWSAVTLFVLPALLAAGIGGFVPHIYREARRAAAVRRQHALGEPLLGVTPAVRAMA